MSLPWLRLYAEFATDPAIQSIAFEDQRHYVVLLCLKASGTLDKAYPSPERRDAVISRGLGLDQVSGREAQRRLIEAGLINEDWQPLKWDERQYQSDRSADRTRRWRERNASDVTVTSPKPSRDATVTAPDTDSDSEESLGSNFVRRRAERESRAVFHAPGERPLAAVADLLVPLPLVDGREASLSATHGIELAKLYPGVDLPAEMRSMRAWLIANPTRRKTASGVLRFVNGWLSKEQNRSRGAIPAGGRKFASKADADYAEQVARHRGGGS